MRHFEFRWLKRSADAQPLQADPDRMRRLQWRVFWAITLGYGFYYVCRLSLNVIKKPLVDAGLFDPAQLGMIGSALFFTYAAGRLVNGFLVDHANVKRFMAIGLMASALIHLALGSLPTFGVFLVLWGANGWFQAMGAPSSIVTIARWFPLRGRGTVYGVWSTSHNIGEAFTYVATGAVVTYFGAAWGMTAAGIIGAIAACLLLLALQERPEVLGLPSPDAKVVEGHGEGQGAIPSVAALQWQVLRNPTVWMLALASGLFYVTRYAINSWGVFFLQEAKGYSALEAGSIISVNAIAGLAGTVASGLVSDRLFGGNRPLPTLMFGGLYVGATALFVLGPAGVVTDTVAMALFGVAMGALLAYLGGMMAMDLVDKSAVGTATGIVGVASYLGAAAQDLLSGQFIQAGKTVVQGQVHYDFTLAGWMWISAAVMSCLVVLSLHKSQGGMRIPGTPQEETQT
jgi:OPA family sugar phosphate sensor protein UhpC-like MFS transporter